MLRTIFKIVKRLSKKKAQNKKSLPWRAFFYIFWKLEERSERINLDIKSTLPIKGSERAVLIETILASDFSSLLDVGTAYGQNLFILGRLTNPSSLFGLDLKVSRIVSGKQIAEEKSLNELSFISANAINLPFEDNTFELITASALFLYLDNESSVAALREMARVCSKRIIILEQHVKGLLGVKEEGEVTGGSFWIRDYYLLFKEAFNQNYEVIEHFIPNPRWQIEKWENTGVVFEINKKEA